MLEMSSIDKEEKKMEFSSKGTILIILGCMVLVQFYDHVVYEAKIDGLRERITQFER
jgi:hypothetical protein